MQKKKSMSAAEEKREGAVNSQRQSKWMIYHSASEVAIGCSRNGVVCSDSHFEWNSFFCNEVKLNRGGHRARNRVTQKKSILAAEEQQENAGRSHRQSKWMIYYSASEGLWKCRHCSWIYAAAKPEKEIISRHKEFCLVGHTEEMASNGFSFGNQGLKKEEPISNGCEDTRNVKDEKSDENIELNGDGPEVTVNANNCNSQEQLHLNVSRDTLGSSEIKDASLTVDAQAEIYVGNKSFKTESSQNDIEACLPDSTAKNSVDGCSKLTDETHLDERLIRIINEGISEGNVEKIVQIIKEQKSHYLLCPVCGSCITKRVILRKRKRKGVGSGSKTIQVDDFESFLSPDHDKRTTVSESYRTSQSLLVDDKEQQSILEASEEIVEERTTSQPLLPIREDDEVYGCLSCFSVFFRKGKCTGPESSVDDENKSGCFYCIPFHFDWWNTEPNEAISSNQEEPSQNVAIETSAGSVTTVSSDIRSEASLTVVTSRINPNEKAEFEGEYSQVRPSSEKDSIEASGTGSSRTSSTALENTETGLNSISAKDSKDCVQSYMINGKYKQRKNDRVNDPEGVFLAQKEISSTSMVHPAKDMDTGASSSLNESANVAEDIQKSQFSNIVKLQLSRKESLKLSESQISSLHNSNEINGVPDSDANSAPEQYPLSNQTDTLVPEAPVASGYASTQNEVDEQRGNGRFCSCFPMLLHSTLSLCSEKKTSIVDQESRLPLLQHEVNIQEPLNLQKPRVSFKNLQSKSVQRHQTFADDKEVEQMLQPDSIVSETSDHRTVIDIDTRPTDTTNVLANAPESPLERVPQPNIGTEWDILKSVVYGGLTVSITSLGIISSAAGAEAKTLDVIVICLGHLISGLLMIVNNMSSLDESQFIEAVGHRHRFNGFVALLSYFIFGTCAPIAYGLSFRKSDDILKKFIVTSGVSLIAIIFLSLGKARVSGRSYIRTLVLYLVTGFWTSIAGFLAGEYIKKLLQKWGINLD